MEQFVQLEDETMIIDNKGFAIVKVNNEESNEDNEARIAYAILASFNVLGILISHARWKESSPKFLLSVLYPITPECDK